MATTKNKKPKIKAEFGLFMSEFGHLEYGVVTSQRDVDNLLAMHPNRTDPIFLQQVPPDGAVTVHDGNMSIIHIAIAYTLQAVFQGITAELRQRGFKI